MKTFVANRVSEIQNKSKQTAWKWVPSEENPADLPSRGIWPLNPDQQSLYCKGPTWLPYLEKWPKQPQIGLPEDEMKKTVNPDVSINMVNVIESERFSTLDKLITVQCYIIRFVTKREARGWSSGHPDAIEKQKVLPHLIKIHQATFFDKEIACLKAEKPLSPKCPILSLQPFIDKEEIMRVGGRLQKAMISESQLHPILISPKDHFTKLLIESVHKNHLHAGANHTLSILREKYWILKGGQTVKKLLFRCVTCQKASKKPMQQIMAPLPDFRCQESPPFTHTGIDFAGPLFIKDTTQSETRKVWIALFTCAATRGIHLEIVTNMSTDSFLAALSRFMARRGMPTAIYSDNAKQFIRADKELKQLWKMASSDKAIQELSTKNIQWHFNPPNSPHWGGFWERLVKSVKTPLKKVLKNALVTESELYTLLCQIEQQINSRPLTAVTDEVGVVPLTPAMILIGRNYHSYPMAPPPRDDEIIKRWRYRQQIEKQFWNAWQKEYLPLLQQRQKWNKEGQELKVGDIVLVLTENKRQSWPLGRVVETFVGRDGHIRSADIKIGDKTFKRSIQQLVKLEMDP